MKVSEARNVKRLRAVVGDCSTVALLILNLSKAIKQSLGGMSCFNHSAILVKDMVLYIQEYTYFLRVYLDVLH